jgi:ABC-type Fe3+ transport system permease subunit
MNNWGAFAILLGVLVIAGMVLHYNISQENVLYSPSGTISPNQDKAAGQNYFVTSLEIGIIVLFIMMVVGILTIWKGKR